MTAGARGDRAGCSATALAAAGSFLFDGGRAMRKMFPLLAVMLLSSGLTLVWAAEEKTVMGEGQCAKCSLGETDACQNAIVVDEGGKKVTYYLEQNPVSKKFHGKICKAPKAVKATGEVTEKDGKMVMTASKIELAK
jgi:hypothetical protein